MCDLTESGSVFAEAREAGNHAFLGTLVHLWAAERTTVTAVTNNEIFAELISPNSPAWLLQLAYTLSTTEARARICAAHEAMRHVTLAHDACLGDTQHRAITGPVVDAIEHTEREITNLINSLDDLWALLTRTFASAMDLSSPAADQRAHIGTLERLLRLGDNLPLAVERVYLDPNEHSFFATAFDCPWITQLIIDGSNHSRLELIRAFGARVRSASPHADQARGLRNFVHVDRSDLNSPARATEAVHQLAQHIDSHGGYDSLGLASLCGVLSVTLHADDAETIVLDSATGSGAHRDVALFLLRLCQATGVLFSAHPAGPVPKHDSDLTVIQFFGFAIACAVSEGLTLGPECLAPCVLACITGTPISLTRAFFNACSRRSIAQLEPTSVDLMLTIFGPLTEGFTQCDLESLTPRTGSVNPENLLAFLDSVEQRVRAHHNLGRPLEVLAAGFAAATGSATLMDALRAILTDAPPIALVATGGSGAEPVGPSVAPTTTTQLVASLLVGPTLIDPVALQRNTLYEDPFNETSPVVSWFWRLVHAMSQPDLRTLLRFWTSGNPPPDGVHPAKYLILPATQMQLPTARTCICALYLWDAYISIEELEAHLRISLENTDSGMEG